MFNIEAFPAVQGDCIWIEYGDPADPKRILIDTGPSKAAPFLKARIGHIPEDDKKFELFVMSHIDDDHIAGILDIHEGARFAVKDVWFNGWRHINDIPLDPADLMGAEQGEKFSRIIRQKGWTWNGAFDQKGICLESAKGKVITLDGGMKLTILSPTLQQLNVLKGIWEAEIEKKGKEPGWGDTEEEPSDILGNEFTIKDVRTWAETDDDMDPSPSNASSIAFLAEYDGKKVLFAADAHFDTLENSILELVGPGKKLQLDLFKVAHHGSKKNISCHLMELLDCDKFLLSSSGYKHSHPHPQAVAKLVCHRKTTKTLFFNYESEFNEGWKSQKLKKEFKYDTEYGDDGYIKISL